MMGVFVIPLLPFARRSSTIPYFCLRRCTASAGFCRRAGRGASATKTLVIFGIMQFFFCLDVVSAVWLYAKRAQVGGV